MAGCRVLLPLIAFFLLATHPSHADLQLAANSNTTYRIVIPDPTTDIDNYAAEELALYLKQITSADFPVFTETELTGPDPVIYVGLSAPALTILGGDPLSGLASQEHVSRSIGNDILLYGKGLHANLHAVLEFLENSLGWRWHSVFEHPALPDTPTVTLTPFARTNAFSFGHRQVGISRSLDYYYQQGMNMGYDSRVARVGADPDRYFSEINDTLKYPHTLFSFIPPNPEASGATRWSWIPRTNYFTTNPEYFSLWDTGQRVDNRQLCFSNRGLRDELTRNVRIGIEHTGARCLVSVAANDSPGPFCYCSDCQALEAQYGSPGGPLCDYLIELCEILATNKPEVQVCTLAYRRSQTQTPPTLPDGRTLPDNLIIDFAPIEDNYFADWTHPDPEIQETYSNLCDWGTITASNNLWAWLYPNPYRTGLPMPVGNVERLITNMRLMHQAGVRGAFTDHNGYHQRAGWSELQAYLFYRLCRNINTDTNAVIEGFMDNMYGPAGLLMRTYLGELEAGRRAMIDLPPEVTYRSSEYDDITFPYLTASNIHRWQGYFDQMEDALSGRPDRELVNVRLVRRELDLATLWKWFDLAGAHPTYYTNFAVCTNRIAEINDTHAEPAPDWENKSINREWYTHPIGTSEAEFFSTIIRGGGVEKPLPALFDSVNPNLIRTFVPTRYSGEPRAVLDPDAARGYAVPVDSPNFPFSLGFHQWDTGTRVCMFSLDLDDIVPGEYQLVALGDLPVTPECCIYFGGGNWNTRLNLGRYVYDPAGSNVWNGYVSMKFDGPTYGGSGEDSVVVDRIFVVRQVTNQVDRYVVKDNPTADDPYDTWDNAAPDIQTAIDAAVAANGDEVIVAPATYDAGGRVSGESGHALTNRVVIGKAIVVRSRDSDPQTAIIKGAWHPGTTNGASAIRCVYMVAGSKLVGFTLTNGASLTTAESGQYLDHLGGGILASHSSCIISNCIVAANSGFGSTAQGIGGGGVNGGRYHDCTIGNNVSTSYGGGAGGCYLYNCRLTGNKAYRGGAVYRAFLYDRCVVSSNSAYDGGGLAGHSATLQSRASDCTLSHNTCTHWGGAAYYAYLSNCTVIANSGGAGTTLGGGGMYSTFIDCSIVSNTASLGGGTYGSTMTNCVIAYNTGNGGGMCRPTRAVNCLIYGNQGYGGGVNLANNNWLESCTIVGNGHSGILIEGSGTAYARNCIIYSNDTARPNCVEYPPNAVVSFSNSCTSPQKTLWDTRSITANPRFVAFGAGFGTSHVPGDYHLSSLSPCCNSGTNQLWMMGALDLDRTSRIDLRFETVDMGCYERHAYRGTLFKMK